MLKSFCFYSCCENAGNAGNAGNSCGCGHIHELNSETCGCGGGSQNSFGTGCGCENQENYGGCGCGGGCGSSHRDAVLINFDDGTQYECPVLSIFDINEQEYIALYHPAKQKALLYRFVESSQGIMLESIDDEEEFELVANAFRNL